MSMFNKTKIKVSMTLDDVIREAYNDFALKDIVPYTSSKFPIGYKPTFSVTDKEGKTITNTDEIFVNFYLTPIKEEKQEEEKPYELGDWKDPEV